jgi:hypothetical protein
LHFALSAARGASWQTTGIPGLQTKQRDERLFWSLRCGPCGGAGVAIRTSRWRTSPGGARREDNTTTAGLVAPLTSRSTTGRTADVTSNRLKSGRKPSPPSESPISWRIYGSIPVPTAARPTLSFSSSIISGTRNSISPRASETGTGRASSTRWQSARWFVQTVTGAAPLVGVASLVRR